MSVAAYIYGKPIMSNATPPGTWAAGDVIVVGATPLVAHEDNPPFAGGTKTDALAAGGGVYAIATDGTGELGRDIYFNPSTSQLTATAAGGVHFGTLVAGPSGDLFGAAPAESGDLGYALHKPNGGATNALPGTFSEATQSTTATLSAAQLLGGFIDSAPAGAITLTLPTAANMVAGVPGAKVGDAFECSVENTAAGANPITLAAGGATLRGGTSIAQNKCALLRIVLTDVTSGSEAYTVYSLIGA